MQRQNGFPKWALAVLAVSGGALGAAAPAAADGGEKPGFYETYRGHHIMGWGGGDGACAYIDGKRLVVYPGEGGAYTSAVQGFKPEPSLRAITKASVKALGEMKLAATAEPNPQCPVLETR